MDKETNANGLSDQSQPESGSNETPTATPEQYGPAGQNLTQNPNKKKKPNLFTIIVVAAIVLLASSGAAYFGYIVPNRPENIWAASLDKTASGYDKLIEYLQTQKDKKGSKYSGNFKTEGSLAADGTINGRVYESDSETNISVGFAGARYSLDLLTITPEGLNSPDLYFKLSGIKGLGGLLSGSELAALGPLIDSLENQWLFVDHTLFDQFASSVGSQANLSSEDLLELASAIGDVNKKYLFSGDNNNAVFQLKESVGNEERDGRQAYHFRAGVSQENLRQYLSELKAKLKETKLNQTVGDGQIDQFFDGLINDSSDIDENYLADVWVDMETKFVRYIRFNETNGSSYSEVGFPYNGGNQYPIQLMMVTPDGPNKGTFNTSITLDTDTNIFDVDIAYELMDTGGLTTKFNADVKIEPSDETLNLQKPEDARPIMEILGPIFGGFLGGSSEGSGSATVNPLL